MFGALGVLLGDMKTKILMALTFLAAIVVVFFLTTNYFERKAEREQNDTTMAGKVQEQKVNSEIAEGSGKINTGVVQDNADKKQEVTETFDQSQKDFEKKVREINNTPAPKERVKIPVTAPAKTAKPEKKIVVEEITIDPKRDAKGEELSAAYISQVWDTYCLAVSDTSNQCVK